MNCEPLMGTSSSESEPLVTVLTPVYNGGTFFRECIESVLAQAYRNWEYLIINNRSTDDTLEIAGEYARKDPRIHVVTNDRFLGLMENFNQAFSLVEPSIGYIKVVCADDWLLPDCLTKMVAFGEAHPNVGIIACHQQSGDAVRWSELPPSVTTLSGRDACRMALLKGTRLFGAPTGFLYRSTLLRQRRPFFPNNQPHADTSACYEYLDLCDYGVVPEILSVERLHEQQVTSQIEPLAAGTVAYLEVLLEYGPRYLSKEEFIARKREVFSGYYRCLGGCLLKLRPARFWRFQKDRLAELGCRLAWHRIIGGAVIEAATEALDPITAFQKIMADARGKA